MHAKKHLHCGYHDFYDSQEQYEGKVMFCVKMINEEYPDIDYIVVRGVSGLAIGGPVSFLTGKKLIIVRKGEETHSDQSVEGFPIANFSFVILDDFACNGTTIKECLNAIQNLASENWSKEQVAKYYGCVFYGRHSHYSPDLMQIQEVQNCTYKNIKYFGYDVDYYKTEQTQWNDARYNEMKKTYSGIGPIKEAISKCFKK